MARTSEYDYKSRLGEVLRRRDPAALHLFLRQSAAGYGPEEQIVQVEDRSHDEMEELMHRMILARADLADLHGASRAWLAQREPGAQTPSPAAAGEGGGEGPPRGGRGSTSGSPPTGKRPDRLWRSKSRGQS